MFWRSLSNLHTLLAGGVGLLMLELLVGYQPVQAQSCTVDPLGGEVCLPDPIPETPNQPEIPDESIETQEKDQPEKSDEPETIDQPDKPNPMVIVPPCFGPCTQFPPAPPYRQFQELVEKTDAADMVITVDGLRYGEIVDPHSLLFTNELNEPGVNAWVRGFGGASSNGAAGHRYANFSNDGGQLGIDIPISDETRIGLFGTYAVMNGTDGARGSWDTDGWGGGAYAEYWTRNVYLRGMVSGGGYSGEHRRKIDGDTAKGDRSGNSWTGVLNIGAPLQSGEWIIEPQALLSYTNTSLDKFSEHGTDRSDRLRFHEMEVDQLGSELSVKFAVPIRDGEHSLFLPSLRVGWAADWGMSGDHQK